MRALNEVLQRKGTSSSNMIRFSVSNRGSLSQRAITEEPPPSYDRVRETSMDDYALPNEFGSNYQEPGSFEASEYLEPEKPYLMPESRPGDYLGGSGAEYSAVIKSASQDMDHMYEYQTSAAVSRQASVKSSHYEAAEYDYAQAMDSRANTTGSRPVTQHDQPTYAEPEVLAQAASIAASRNGSRRQSVSDSNPALANYSVPNRFGGASKTDSISSQRGAPGDFVSIEGDHANQGRVASSIGKRPASEVMYSVPSMRMENKPPAPLPRLSLSQSRRSSLVQDGGETFGFGESSRASTMMNEHLSENAYELNSGHCYDDDDEGGHALYAPIEGTSTDGYLHIGAEVEEPTILEMNSTVMHRGRLVSGANL